MLKNNMSIVMVVGNTAEMSLINIQANCSNFLVQISRENEVANRHRGRMVHYMKRVWSWRDTKPLPKFDTKNIKSFLQTI